MSKLREGDTVRCLAGNIDNGRGNGMIGRINGFARLCPYHAREALVSFDDHPEDSGWFWVHDLAGTAS